MEIDESVTHAAIPEEIPVDSSAPRSTLDAYQVEELDDYDLALRLHTVIVSEEEHDEFEPVNFDEG